MKEIALFGASGAIGRSIADALRSQGKNYRVVGRSQRALARDFGSDPLAETVEWNPNDPASVRAAARGVDTIFYLVGVPYNEFQLHPVIMKQTLDGAIAEGVKRIVLVGTVYPYGRPQTTPVTENHPREPHTFKGQKRKEQEDLLLEADAKGLIRGAVLRLPDFYGPGVENSFLWSAFKAAATGKRAPMVGPVDTPHEFVFVPDVGPVALALAGQERAYGKWWNFAGAGTATQREMAEQIFAAAGSKPKIMASGKWMLRLAGHFNPFMREMVEMHYLLTTPIILDDSALNELLGGVHKTSYADGIKQTLAAMPTTTALR